MNIFLDMDSTITDFPKAVKNIGAEKGLVNESYKQEMYDAIEKAGVSFWANMDWLPDGKALYEMLKPYKPVLLTSPGKFQYAKEGKILWVQKNTPELQLFFSNKKWHYADQGNILIDDDAENVEEFRQNGGLAIQHESKEKTEQEFLELLWKKPWLKVI